jgi:hypothetical protein
MIYASSSTNDKTMLLRRDNIVNILRSRANGNRASTDRSKY